MYALPAGLPVNGEVSNATDDVRTPFSDIEADLNAARPIVAGGTGATSASAARTNLGLAIGTDVQAYSAALASIAGLTTAADRMIYTTAANTYAVATLSSFARTILDDADAATVRATIGAQASDGALTTLAGLSLAAGDVLYATGADTVARLAIGTAGQVLQVNSGATAPEWATVSGISLQSPVTMTGTSQDFGSIPATVNRVTLNWNAVSVSGTDTISILLGTASAFETTGYSGVCMTVTTGGNAGFNHSVDFRLYDNVPTATMQLSGTVVFTRVSGNIWAVAGQIGPHDNTRFRVITGNKTLAADLTRIRVQTTGGVQTFDNGTISMSWE